MQHIFTPNNYQLDAQMFDVGGGQETTLDNNNGIQATTHLPGLIKFCRCEKSTSMEKGADSSITLL